MAVHGMVPWMASGVRSATFADVGRLCQAVIGLADRAAS
jgi:hypothetical protein